LLENRDKIYQQNRFRTALLVSLSSLNSIAQVHKTFIYEKKVSSRVEHNKLPPSINSTKKKNTSKAATLKVKKKNLNIFQHAFASSSFALSKHD
jgi:hypothetical protein